MSNNRRCWPRLSFEQGRLKGLIALGYVSKDTEGTISAKEILTAYNKFLCENPSLHCCEDEKWAAIFGLNTETIWVDRLKLGLRKKLKHTKKANIKKKIKKNIDYNSTLTKTNNCNHREEYCNQNKKQCEFYSDCLNHHVLVEKLDDVPFKKYINSKATCYKEGISELKLCNPSNFMLMIDCIQHLF